MIPTEGAAASAHLSAGGRLSGKDTPVWFVILAASYPQVATAARTAALFAPSGYAKVRGANPSSSSRARSSQICLSASSSPTRVRLR